MGQFPPTTSPEQRGVLRDLGASFRYAFCPPVSFSLGSKALQFRWLLIIASFIAFMGSTSPDHPFGGGPYLQAFVSAVIFILAIGLNASGEHPWWRPPYERDEWAGR